MSATLISRSPDLKRLEADGFRLRVVQGTAHHLLVEMVPAVTSNCQVAVGTLYCPLELDSNGKTTNPCQNHQCWWIGEPPCDAEGRMMSELISNQAAEDKGDGIRTTIAFSRKRGDKQPYADLYEKIWTYVLLIWPEAKAIDPSCDPRSDKQVRAVVEAQERVFHYPDMATTRAGIGAATTKLLLNKVAIIGLGGTGSYILDLMAKTPVNELHLFDKDAFSLHNAFRSPGAPSKEQLTEPSKVDWFGSIYDRMRKGIVRHPYHVTAENLGELAGFDFVFVAIDTADARKVILEGLIAMKVPFIDVGLDIALDMKNSLRGIARSTVGTSTSNTHVQEVVSYAQAPADEIYRNVQVADLNMLNAAMAVVKWKKIVGFYADDMHEHHSLYTVATHALSKEDKA